jgi:hypothetical protein
MIQSTRLVTTVGQTPNPESPNSASPLKFSGCDMQMGRIACVTSQRAFFRKKEAGWDSEFDENAEIFELEKQDFDDVKSTEADVEQACCHRNCCGPCCEDKCASLNHSDETEGGRAKMSAPKRLDTLIRIGVMHVRDTTILQAETMLQRLAS